MRRTLTITIDEDVYAVLERKFGHDHVISFISPIISWTPPHRVHHHVQPL